MKHRVIAASCGLILLAGCATSHPKNYEDAAHCQALGNSSGTKEYDDCMDGERKARMLEQQRREFDQMKQDERDYRNRRY